MDHATRAWVQGTLSPYWSKGADLLGQLPMPDLTAPASEPLPPRVEMVTLPEWAAHAGIGIEGGILVPSYAIAAGDTPAYARTDWWLAAAWYLEARAERAHEAAHGPIHSYSIRLGGWEPRIWQHAWVNRIALFLRAAAARHFQIEETALGALPESEIVLTHDVDAVTKTLRIRFKQSAFDAFNAARAVATGRPSAAIERVAHGLRFAIGPGEYWTIDRMCAMEEARGRRSIFHVYAGNQSERSLGARVLFDPSYDVDAGQVRADLRRLVERGWTVGLHPSFDAWSAAADIQQQKRRLESAIGRDVTACRQHWLRFSWAHTWAAQEEAGLRLDSTLGFNDRPGFRIGAALRVHPLDERRRPRAIEALPLVLMDSHLYDYAAPDTSRPEAGIATWLGEVLAVRGTASVLWHPHVLSDDYGWAEGYEEVLRVAG